MPKSQSAVAAVGYVRISRADHGHVGAALAAQRRLIRAHCARRGWRLIDLHVDVEGDGAAGGNAGRAAALTMVRGGMASALVTARVSCLCRSVVDAARTLEMARSEGWNLVLLDLGVDLSTPAGEMLANVMVNFAQYERRLIGQRTREALAVKKAQGVRIGRPLSVPPSVVRRMKSRRSRGDSFAAIANRLNHEQVPTGHGAAAWHPSTVRAVLQRV